MKRRASPVDQEEEDSSSVEVERITLNIDKYLNELGRSLDRSNPNRLPSYMHEFAKNSVQRLGKFSFNQKSQSALGDPQPSTSSGDENLSEHLSSANSQTAMIRRSSNLDLYRSQDKLNKNDVIRNFSASQQNLANFGQMHRPMHGQLHGSIRGQMHGQSLHHPNQFGSSYMDRNQAIISNDHIIQNDDDDEQLDSVQFTTPFEFKQSSNKKFAKHSGKSRYLAGACPPSIELRWRNVTYLAKNVSSNKERHTTNVRYVGGKRLILDKQSGELHGGELAAIIGPSGAGKSTLLECLAGRRTLNLTGSITINYSPDYLDRGERVKVSFIAQRDNQIGVLTVKEILMFASRLKNYGIIKNSHYHPRLVNSILVELGLDKCANIPSNKISGGQLKRLSFATELISGPDILLLDEPTSGLDSSSAASTIQLLKKLTDLRRINRSTVYKPPAIICSIHQPSARVLKIFHKIYVLSNDGRCVYNGPPELLLLHLAKFGLHCPQFHNPADFIVEIACGDYTVQPINVLAKDNRPSPNELFMDENPGSKNEFSKHEKFKDELGHVSHHHLQPHHSSSQLNVESLSSDLSSDYPMNKRMISMKVTKVVRLMKQQRFPVFLHFFLLLKRTYLTTSRDPKLTWFRILQALFIGLVMAFLYDYPIGKDGGCIIEDSNSTSSSNSTGQEDDFSLNSKTQDNIAFIFFITLFTVMAAMMPTVLTFPAEVAILIQERNNGWYSCWTYYWTKIIADTPYQLMVTIIFCSIVYPGTGQPWVLWRFALFNLISVLVAMIAQSVGILFGTIYVRSVETAVFMAPLSMAPVFLISGFFARISKLPMFLKPIAIISYVRYAFEAFLITMYGFSRCEDVPMILDNSGVSENLAFNPLAAGAPGDLNAFNENRRNAAYQNPRAAGRSRARMIFRRFPNYASEFPKVWSGFYNPVAYAQEMEKQNVFTSAPGVFDPSTPPPTLLEEYPDNFVPQQPPLYGLQNSTSSLMDVNSAFPTGNYVLNHFSLKDENLYENLAILCFILFLLRLAGYILLIYKTNQKR